jgi:tetratricopeptide (TPR) repeat protein
LSLAWQASSVANQKTFLASYSYTVSNIFSLGKGFTMTQASPKFIQNPVRLTDSLLWEIQKNYFLTMGIEAWKEEVPFYISSNTFIGHRYASLVYAFIKDYVQLHPEAVNQCFHILELGSGTGKFSFHFLKAFQEILALEGSNQPFCYVITDLIEKNIDFCEKNQSLQPFLQSNQLDFASFDIEHDKDIFLKKKQKKYSELKASVPLIIIGNYVFDCVKHDAFEYENNVFKEVKLGLTSRYPNFNKQTAKHLNDLRLQFESCEVKIDDYYDKSELNQILREYAENLKDKEAKLMMPLGAFEFLDNIKSLTHNNFLMIAGDKGVALAEGISFFSTENRVTYDGCYSFMVNFHAMGSYLQKKGGDYYPTQNSNHFKVNLFSQGISFSELPRTRTAFAALETLGPDEYCYIYDEFLTSGYRFSLKGLLSFLRLSQWDPNAFALIHDRLLQLTPVASNQLKVDISAALAKVRDNIYPINFGSDTYLLLGIYYQSQQKLDQAIDHYQKSLETYGDNAASHNNLGIIYETKKNFAKALEHYKKSVELDKKNLFAKRKVLRLTGKPNVTLLLPFLKGLLVLGALSGAVYLILN